MKNKPALVDGKKYVITGATEHSVSKSAGVYFPQVVTYTGGEFDGVEPKSASNPTETGSGLR